MKTNEKLAWWLGPKTQDQHDDRRAPNTCHHTETLLSMASRWLEKMLISATSTSTISEEPEELLMQGVAAE